MGAGAGAGDGVSADSGAFLEEERATMGERWFRQEYLCEFVDAVSGVFDRETGGAGDDGRLRSRWSSDG